MLLISKISLFALLIFGITGCMQTTYRDVNNKEIKEVLPFGSDVTFDLSREYYRDPPDCITVLPVAGGAVTAKTLILEDATSRYLSRKVNRVIGPHERQTLIRKHVVNLDVVGDRRIFSALTHCRFYIRPTITSEDEMYVIVWAQRSIGLEFNLIRGSDDHIMWHADHHIQRSDGGLPIMPLAAGMAALRAGQLYNDKEQLPSMIDDALRRMFVTMPDVRDFSTLSTLNQFLVASSELRKSNSSQPSISRSHIKM